MAIQSNFPAIKPSLMLDFANTKQLDSRITYTRASTATFYNGVTTAMAEQNLVLQSQTFDNASWVKTTATVTADSFAAPDGTTTADTLTATNANATLLQTFTATATAYTFSVYIYRKTGTGNVDITVDGTTYATQSITGAWVRYSVTTTPTAGSKTAGIRLVTNGDEVYIWGAQLENRSSATAYTATTTQAITNYIPKLQSAASGVARFDNNPTTGESLGLLIEESRTNLFTYSSDFSNAIWTKTGSTITADTIVAPDGTLTGDKLVESATTAVHKVAENSGTVTSGGVYTFSVYAKAAERNFVVLQLDSTLGTGYAFFNLSTGAVATTANLSGTPSITSVGNGWYRCVISDTTTATTTQPCIIYVSNADTVTSYAGDGYAGIYIWGAQLEAGAFATSYIPTVASQVTRAADAASMTGINFSTWFNNGEFTLYAEAENRNGTNNITNYHLATISDGTGANAQVIRIEGGDNRPLCFGSYNGTGNQWVLYGTAVSKGSFAKCALGYAFNNVGFASNAGTVATDTVAQIPSLNLINIAAGLTNSQVLNGCMKKLAFYPFKATSTQLQALTS